MGSDSRRMNAIIKDPQHFKRLVESVQIFQERQDFMDLCFICARGHRVFAHKLLLCSVSTQMKKMFLELPDNIDLITIHLPDIEARILRLMFDFLYGGSLKVINSDYTEFNNLRNLLGIVLHRSSSSEKASQLLQPEAPLLSQSQPPIPQVFYVQAPGPNPMAQGQMQYVLAAPGTQVMHVQAAAAGQVMPSASHPQPGQVMQVAAPTTSMPQGQIMQMAPAIMSQASGQMVQGGSQVVTTPIQQNNMMQVVSQNSAQVVPMVAGNQMVQCSNAMVVQGSPSTMINNNQMPGNIQNQVPQATQRPQYVMTSSANQMPTSRARAQYTQPQMTPQQRTVVRSRATTQVAQPIRTNAINNVAGSSTTQQILTILQENYDNPETIENLTARDLREILEPKLGVDLSNQEEHIDQVLELFRNESGENESVPMTQINMRESAEKPASAKMKVTRPRKKKVSWSDDEDDEDFDPKKAARRSKKR